MINEHRIDIAGPQVQCKVYSLCNNQIDILQSRINFFHRKRDRGNAEIAIK